MLEGYQRQFRAIEVLSAAQLEAMHQASLEILEKAGANVRHDGALALLAEHGCHVDSETQTAHLPTGLVEQCLQSCPSSYSIRGRDPAADVRVGGTRVYFMQGMGMRYVDPDTWELRPATLREHAEGQIVGDALASVHVMDACFSYTDIAGVPPVMQQLECLANGFRYSSKAQHYGYLKDSHRFAIKMAQGLGVTLNAEIDVAPPIVFGHDAVDALISFAELGWGLEACPGGSAGATSPGSLAGSVVQMWAATLAFIVLAQLVRPGAPVGRQVTGTVPHPKWGHPLDGAPESWYLGAMTNQLCLRHGIPITSPVGFCGQAKMFDYQAAWEKALGVLFSVSSGSHLHVLHGSHGEELGFSNILQILDDDIARSIGRLLDGTEVSDETMATDLICEVAEAQGELHEPGPYQEVLDEGSIPADGGRLEHPRRVGERGQDRSRLARQGAARRDPRNAQAGAAQRRPGGGRQRGARGGSRVLPRDRLHHRRRVAALPAGARFARGLGIGGRVLVARKQAATAGVALRIL